MLLITDDTQRSEPLRRMLALWGPCDTLLLNATREPVPRPGPLVVIDADLSQRVVVEAVRAVLAQLRGSSARRLCLLRDQSLRSTTQANAIGATDLIAADVSASVLMAKIHAIVRVAAVLDEATAAIQHHVITASAAISDMLTAAQTGRPLPIAAINDSVASINCIADTADVESWLDMVWNHDDLTYQHCLLVAGLTATFARKLGFSRQDRTLMTCAAVLHDIGKAKVPLEILHKIEKLTPAEMAMIKTHPQLGYDMLTAQGGFGPDVLDVVLSHHEYLDGSGYPRGLRGDRIPDIVRIVTICDIYAALIERRSYKAQMPPRQAFDILLGMGTKLDSALLRAFGGVVLPEAA